MFFNSIMIFFVHIIADKIPLSLNTRTFISFMFYTIEKFGKIPGKNKEMTA